MLFYTHNPLKFAFSEEKTDFKEIAGKKTGKLQQDAVKFGILGVPFDSTATYKPGARFGPTLVREASYNFERYNLILDKNLDASSYDFGDVQVIHGNFKKTCVHIQSTVSELVNEDIIPIIIGGEHTISYGVLKALEIENTTIIHFDAHMDLRDQYMNKKYSHATVMRRIFDMNPKEVVQIGIRSCSHDEISFAGENKIKYYSSMDINEDIKRVEKTLKNLEGSLYVTVDMDVLDPAYAPSVGNPAPCGLNSFQLERLIHCLKGKKVVGLDLAEVSATQIGDITSINGAKVIYDFLSLH